MSSDGEGGWLLVPLGNKSTEEPVSHSLLLLSPSFPWLCEPYAAQSLGSLLQNSTVTQKHFCFFSGGTRAPKYARSSKGIFQRCTLTTDCAFCVDFSFSKESCYLTHSDHLVQDGERGRGMKCNYLQCNWAVFAHRVMEATEVRNSC